MIKIMGPTTRNDLMTHEEYVQYYTTKVVSGARVIPGMRKYFANPTYRAIGGGPPPWDSVSEMYWDSTEAAREVFMSEEWHGSRADHPGGLIGRFHFSVEEEKPALDHIAGQDRDPSGARVKYLAFLNRRDGMSRADFQKYWFDRHLPLALTLPGLQRYRPGLPTFSFNGDSPLMDPMEPAPFDGVVEMWFGSEQDFDAARDSEVWERMRLDYYLNFAQGRMHLLVKENLVFDDTL